MRSHESGIVLEPTDFRTRERCPLCYAFPQERLFRATFQRLYRVPRGIVVLSEAAKRLRVLHRCVACGLTYHSRVPSRETLDLLYTDKSVFFSWAFDSDRRQTDTKLTILKALLSTNSVRVLDVGCHTGRFLGLLPRQWLKHGLDVNPIAVREAKISVPSGAFWEGCLEDVKLPQHFFDLVTLWDVVEHLEDLKTGLETVINSLAPGGILAVETGDAASPMAKILGAGWYYWNLLEHVNFLSPSVLTRHIERRGLRVIVCNRTLHDTSDTLTRNLKFLCYLALTLGGRVSKPWIAASAALNKKGTPPSPTLKDHFFLVARKE